MGSEAVQQKLRAWGPGLEGGVVGKSSYFMVEAVGDDVGTLGFSVEGPSQAKIEYEDNGDGSYDVRYWPTKAGKYAVHVLMDDKDIQHSPFTAEIMNSPCKDFYPDKDGEGGPVDVQVKDNGNGTFTCTYTTHKLVKKHMDLWGRVHGIHGSPFRMGAFCDPKKVKMSGPGVAKTGLKAFQPTYFTIDCAEAGQEASLGVTQTNTIKESQSQPQKLTQDQQDQSNQEREREPLEDLAQEQRDQAEKLTVLMKERENTIKEKEDSKKEHKLTQDQQDQSDQVEKLTALLKERERELQKTITAMEDSKREQQKLTQEQRDQAEKLKVQMKEKEATIKEMEDSKSQEQKLIQEQQSLSNQVQKLTVQMKEKEDTIKEMEDSKSREQQDQRDYTEKLAVQMKEKEDTIKEMEDSKRKQQKLIQEQRDQAEKLTVQMKEKEDTIKEMEDSKRELQKLTQEQKDQAEKLTVQMKEKEDTSKEMEDMKSREQKLIQEQQDQRDHAEKLAVQMTEMKSVLEKISQKQMEADQQRAAEIPKNPTQIIAGAEDKLLSVRKKFIKRVSDPVLNELLDELLDEKIITYEEMGTAMGERLTQNKARSVIDMVCKKGKKASSFMIGMIHQLDSNLSEELQLNLPPTV